MLAIVACNFTQQGILEDEDERNCFQEEAKDVPKGLRYETIMQVLPRGSFADSCVEFVREVTDNRSGNTISNLACKKNESKMMRFLRI